MIIRCFTLLDGINQCSLGRNDTQKDVGDHDGADDRAHMNKGSTAGKYLKHTPCNRDQYQEQHHTKGQAMLCQRAADERFIDRHNTE